MNWNTIEEFPAYLISDEGEIRNGATGRVKRQQQNTIGLPYRVTCFHRTENGKNRTARRTVHRLVATAFVPNPLAHPIVRHIDGNCANNSASNLAWGTWTENQLDATRHGTRNTSKSGRRFGDELRARIVAMSESGKSDNQIAKELGEYQGSVSRVMRDHRRTARQSLPFPALEITEETRAMFAFAGREIINAMNDQNRNAGTAKKARAA